MAFTRNTTHTGGLLGTIIKQTDGKFEWFLKEKFTDATVDSKTGGQEGTLTIAQGAGVADYDTAAAKLKEAFTAAG
tara:strand:- start:364 stop:591 length:228 start_codon:yes stop_codon:yes gene_type:complete